MVMKKFILAMHLNDVSILMLSIETFRSSYMYDPKMF